MKLKFIISFIFISLFMSFQLYGQTHYYYYQGKRINLEVDNTKIDLWVDSNFDIGLLKNIDKIDYNNGEQYKEEKRITLEFKNILTNEDRKVQIASILQLEGVRNYSLYFNRENTSSIGTSNIFYVKLKNEQDYEILKKLVDENHIEIIHKNKFMPLWYKLKVKSEKTSIESSNILYETGFFAEIDPAFMFHFKENCTNDSDFNQLWGLNNSQNPSIDINACAAWNITQGNGVNVGVLDKGIDKTHNDLNDNISTLSFDTQNGTSPSVFDGSYHGTHVAGIIGAEKDNNLQVVGVAPQSKIISISHSLYPTRNVSEELANGISWAWQNGVDVINNSWGDQGGRFYNQLHSALMENAINNALNNGRNGLGTIIVFASGNRAPAIDYPANSNSKIITVGAINSNGTRSNFSGFGNELDVVAPGVGILSTVPNQSITPDDGTSMAAPHVTGVVALMLSVNPTLTVQQVSTIIESTAQKVGNYNYTTTTGRTNGTWNNEMGYGLVDALAAVQRVSVPQISVTLEPVGANYVAVHMVGANGTDINNQGITATTWEKVSNGGGCYASFSGTGFEGLANGNCTNWTVYAKITATNSFGTTTIYRTITPPASYPCDNNYKIMNVSENEYEVMRIIDPCKKSAQEEQVENLQKNENASIVVFNYYGVKVLESSSHKINVSTLKNGIYILKALVNTELITLKIIR